MTAAGEISTVARRDSIPPYKLHRKRKAELAEYGRMQAFALAFATVKPVLMLPAPVETMGLFDWLTTTQVKREMVEVR